MQVYADAIRACSATALKSKEETAGGGYTYNLEAVARQGRGVGDAALGNLEGDAPLRRAMDVFAEVCVIGWGGCCFERCFCQRLVLHGVMYLVVCFLFCFIS